MKSEKLNEAIALIRAGRNNDARQILFDFIRNEPENEVAWIWMAETLTSNPDRMKIYHACLQINPNSKIAKMAISRLTNLMQDEMPGLPLDESHERPFSEDGTFDPAARERTGHTGALIGADGSYILSAVGDFDEVIDLRPHDTELLSNRLDATLNSGRNIESRESSSVEIGKSKDVETEPNLSALVDDETFNSDRYGDRDREIDAETADHTGTDDFSSILDERIFNGIASKEPPEVNSTPIKPDNEVKKEDEGFESSLSEKFLRDDETGDLKDPDFTFNYNFHEDSDVKLDFEPDLTSFLENENIEIDPSRSLGGSFGLHQDEIEEDFNFDDIPLQDALSLEELGFTGAGIADISGQAKAQSDLGSAPVEVVKRELIEEFNYIEPMEDVAGKKKRKRKFMFIGAAALVLVTGLSLVTVFAFPGILSGGQKMTPWPTIPAAVAIPSATFEKIVLPPVLTMTPGTLVNEIQDTPAMTATETPVIIAMPSTTLASSNTPTLTRTSTTAFLPTRTRTPTNTQEPDSNTSTPTRTPTRTPTNTPTNTPSTLPTATRTLIPTASNTPTNTLIPPTNTPFTPPPTDTPVPPPTDTPVPAPTSTP